MGFFGKRSPEANGMPESPTSPESSEHLGRILLQSTMEATALAQAAAAAHEALAPDAATIAELTALDTAQQDLQNRFRAEAAEAQRLIRQTNP